MAAVLAAATTTSVSVKAQPAPFAGIVVFGTSLSDPGNAFALRGGTNTPPDYLLDPFLVPSAPYARGGHHFSNGATWIEEFARPLGLAGSVKPAFRASASDATNFAVGAARAREDGVNVNLPAQVEAFLTQAGGVAPSDRLYVIEMGGNDIRDALVAYVGGGGNAGAGAVLQAANIAIANAITTLYGAGARQFLVWRAPNVGLTPAIRTLDSLNPGAAYLAGVLTQGFNAGLDGVVAQLTGLPGISIARLDAERILNNLVTAPARFDLTNVTAACVTPHVPPFTCQSPDEFLYWDGIHPTRAVHMILAQEASA
ncbi:MAG: SGNH/GDSL hydrolase family protein, partial [Vicinamibacterales bacterium]